MNHLKARWLAAVALSFLYLVTTGQTALEVAQVTITVSDLDKAVQFYEKVLSFEKVGEFEYSGKPLEQLLRLPESGLKVKAVRLQLGDEFIELQAFQPNGEKRSIPADSRSNDRWFQHIAIVVSDMDAAYARLRQSRVVFVSTSPQTLPDYLPAAAGIAAFYFRDPDGHNLELIHFPAGKGNPKWQEMSGKLFLGIDHTAIGIDDTAQDSIFYTDRIGLAVAGHSENYGSQQEHLNQVFGARLLITGLKAQQGFGVEFLEYLSPPGGRAYPADSKPTDLWHWHTCIRVADLDKVYRQFQRDNCAVISDGITAFKHPFLHSERAFMARDTDGHALLIFE